MKIQKSQKLRTKHHFLKRWKERTGVDITSDDYVKILEKMKKEGKMVKNTHGKLLYKIRYNGMIYRIIYDPLFDCMVTVLP